MTVFLQIYKKLFRNRVMKTRTARVLVFAVVLNVVFGLLFYYAERNVQQDLTIVDAIWWAMVTMTTVGYGDFFAHTPAGRFLISYPCMIVGIGIIGYLVGSVAETVLDHVSKRKKGLLRMKSKNHILICNYPHFEKIHRLVEELQRSYRYRDCDIVLVTDKIQELPEELKSLGLQFVQGDPVREEVLARANVTECSGVFILARDPGDPSSDEKTFAIGTIIELIERENGRPIQTVAEVVNKDNIKMMRRSRVDGIVSSDGILDGLIVQEFLNPGVHDIVHQILTNAVGSQFYILETRLRGKKVAHIQSAMLQHPANIQLIGVSRQGQNILSPGKEMVIKENDRLIILAEHRAEFAKVEQDILSQEN